MKKIFVAMSALLIACVFASASPAESDPYFLKPSKPAFFQLPSVNEESADNGMKTLFWNEDRGPVAYCLMTIPLPVRDESEIGYPYLAHEMILRGMSRAAKKDIQALLRETLNRDKNTKFMSLGKDGLQFSSWTLARHYWKFLSNASDLVMNSMLDEANFNAARDALVAESETRWKDAAASGRDLALRFSAGSYLTSNNLPSPEAAKHISQESLLLYMKEMLTPKNTTLLIQGQFDEKEVKKSIKAYFGNWKNSEVKANEGKSKPAKIEADVLLYPIPGATKTGVFWMSPLPERGSDDYAFGHFARFFFNGNTAESNRYRRFAPSAIKRFGEAKGCAEALFVECGRNSGLLLETHKEYNVQNPTEIMKLWRDAFTSFAKDGCESAELDAAKMAILTQERTGVRLTGFPLYNTLMGVSKALVKYSAEKTDNRELTAFQEKIWSAQSDEIQTWWSKHMTANKGIWIFTGDTEAIKDKLSSELKVVEIKLSDLS